MINLKNKELNKIIENYRDEIALAVLLFLSILNSIFFIVFVVLLYFYMRDLERKSYINESQYISVFNESIVAVKDSIGIIEGKYPPAVTELLVNKIKYFSEKKPSPTEQDYYIEYFDFCICVYILTANSRYSLSRKNSLLDDYNHRKEYFTIQLKEWREDPFKNKAKNHEFKWLDLNDHLEIFWVLGRENDISAYQGFKKIIPFSHILHPPIGKNTPIIQYKKRSDEAGIYYGKILERYFEQVK